MATDSEEYLAVLKASYDYTPQSEDEIALQEDQLVFLLQKVDDDWWKVKVKGDSQEGESPVGLVPAAYVEPADHTSVVKAVYDYEAGAPGELSVKEDELLFVFDTEDEWLLVQSQVDGGKAGFVPGNYVESASEGGPSHSTSAPSLSSIVVPTSPPPPASNYQDPADRVASTSTKVKADSIQTWPVSELDKKGKKKKGTLGVGNGSVFFASESDKTPVQKWQSVDIDRVSTEKSKHVHITIGGSTPSTLHFQATSKDNADAIAEKLESSKALSTPTQPQKDENVRLPPIRVDVVDPEKTRKSGASVRFSESSPVIIPARDTSEEDPDEGDVEEESPGMDHSNDPVESAAGEDATALYDFEADGEDELSVKEGERLLVLEKDGDEWWKCQNTNGVEGVVPASYLELTSGDSADATASTADARTAETTENAHRQAELDRAAAEEADKQRAMKDRAAKERAAKELAENARAERKKRDPPTKVQPATILDRPAEKPISSSSSSTGEPSKTGRRSNEGPRGVPSPDQTRIWHDRSGQFRVEAAFLGFHGGKLRLHKVNGVVVEVPSEKMSLEDIRYVEKLTSRKKSSAKAVTPSDDDEPLEARRKSLHSESSRDTASRPSHSTKSPQIDWFDFFLSAGCDVDDCTRYAASFERDKIDDSILPDITDSTMRSLGLREGDIIRVTKAIDKRKPREKTTMTARQEQILRDEEYARQLQDESTRKQSSTSPPPKLFTNPGGGLKNNTTARRGRPQPSKSLLSSTVDLNAITTASDQIQRTGSPQVPSSTTLTPSSPAASKSSNSASVPSGFGDDAWTNRPSSTRPLAPTPPAASARTSSAPPAPPPAPSVQPPLPDQSPGKSLAKTTEADIFDQLSRLSQLNTNKQSPSPASTSSPAVVPVPPTSFQFGLGMGSSPVPIGQHLQNPQIGFIQPPPPINGPRGPFAPVPANQGLLQPLIPTNTGFASFVPTRPTNVMPSMPNQPPLPPFSGKPVSTFPSSPPMVSHPTGAPYGGFGQGNSFQSNGFGAQPTGFNPSPSPQFLDNGMASPSISSSISDATSPANIFAQMKTGALLPPAANSPSSNVSPANVFAQMKAGRMDIANPPPPDKYDPLRPNPLIAQPTGWGYQGVNYQTGYPR